MMFFLGIMIGIAIGVLIGIVLGAWTMRDSKANKRAAEYRRLWRSSISG